MSKKVLVYLGNDKLLVKEIAKIKKTLIWIPCDSTESIDRLVSNLTISNPSIVFKLHGIKKVFIIQSDKSYDLEEVILQDSHNVNDIIRMVSGIRTFTQRELDTMQREFDTAPQNIKETKILALIIGERDVNSDNADSDIDEYLEQMRGTVFSGKIVTQIDKSYCPNNMVRDNESGSGSSDMNRLCSFWLPVYKNRHKISSEYDFVIISSSTVRMILPKELCDNSVYMDTNMEQIFGPRNLMRLICLFYKYAGRYDGLDLNIKFNKYIEDNQNMIQMTVKNMNCSVAKNKKKMIVVSYYGSIEQIKLAEDSLAQHFEVYDFPLLKIRNEGGDCVDKIISMIRETDAEYILWWLLHNITKDDLIKIKRANNKIMILYYNWDEPFNWERDGINLKKDMIDYAFITCSGTVSNYKKARCLYPGFSQAVHYPIKDNTYICDISIICTNLYESYADQIICRKQLVDNIYKNRSSYTFKIFGPESFRSSYPDCYQQFVKYDDTNDIFNRSKINICTHVIGNQSGYLNERVFMILGSGGLLYIDPVQNSILRDNVNCVVINPDAYIDQILNILAHYEAYDDIKKNGFELSKNYRFDRWGDVIRNDLASLSD